MIIDFDALHRGHAKSKFTVKVSSDSQSII